MSLVKTTNRAGDVSWNEAIGVFSAHVYKEGRKWWLSIGCDWTHVTLDEFWTKKEAFARLEDVRGLLYVATHDEANKLFDVQSNLPHGFVPGSSYAEVA